MSTISKTVAKLHDPEHRKAFASSQINVGIPFQLRAMMKARGWTQADLAARAEMLQPRISGLMTPGKTRPNIETLRRIAEAFDCGLVVRFAPFSELVQWSEKFDPESFSVPDFDHDDGFAADQPPPSALAEASTLSNAFPHQFLTHTRCAERAGERTTLTTFECSQVQRKEARLAFKAMPSVPSTIHTQMEFVEAR